MSSCLATLAALLMLFGAGFGVTMLLLPDSTRMAVAELIALSWLFGTAIISLTLWLLGIVVRGVTLQITVTIICLGLASIGIGLWQRRKVSLRFPWPLNWRERVLAVLLCLEIALVFILTFKHTLGWDGLVIFGNSKHAMPISTAGRCPPHTFPTPPAFSVIPNIHSSSRWWRCGSTSGSAIVINTGSNGSSQSFMRWEC